MNSSSTEFKSFANMSPEELAEEQRQEWSVVKSDTTVWVHRNGVPYMPVVSRRHADAQGILARYGLPCAFVDDRQPTFNPVDFRQGMDEAMQDFIDLTEGRRWRVRLRRLWRKLMAAA